MVHEGALYQWDKYPRLPHTITLLNKVCTRQIPLLVTWVPSLRNHESHFLSIPILHSSKMNTRVLSYIGPKLWNSLPPYIRSIKSHKTFMKYIQQFISGGNL